MTQPPPPEQPDDAVTPDADLTSDPTDPTSAAPDPLTPDPITPEPITAAPTTPEPAQAPVRTRFATPAASAQVDTADAPAGRTQAEGEEPEAVPELVEEPQPVPASLPDPEPAAAPDPTSVTSAQVDTADAPAERTQAEGEEPEGEESAEEHEGEPAAEREPLPRLLVALAAFAAMLLIATVALGVYAVVNRPSGVVSTSTRESATKAALADAKTIFSYDYRHLSADFAAGLAVTTGDFRKEFQRTSKIATDLVPRYKGSQVAEVVTGGVISASSKSVVVLVFLDLQAVSSLHKDPSVTPDRIEMTMVPNGSGWLVTKIKAL